MSKFSDCVYSIVSHIPKGRVMSYKQVAIAAGSPKAFRAVGNLMNKNKDTARIPCHRVVKSDGTLGGYARGAKKKLKMLEKEGVPVRNNRIGQGCFLII